MTVGRLTGSSRGNTILLIFITICYAQTWPNQCNPCKYNSLCTFHLLCLHQMCFLLQMFPKLDAVSLNVLLHDCNLRNVKCINNQYKEAYLGVWSVSV